MKHPIHHKEHTHPVHAQHYGDDAPLGLRMANRVVERLGSWRFIIIQSCALLAWIVLNTLQWTGVLHFDEYPYILLNLALSFQAAFTGPIILLAANAQTIRDHALWTEDYETNQRAYQKIIELEQQILSLQRQIQHAIQGQE